MKQIIGYNVIRLDADGGTEYLRIERTSPIFVGRWFIDQRRATTFTSEETARKDADRLTLREPAIGIVPVLGDV